MGIEAFVMKYKLEGDLFANEFLKSPDFDLSTLREICQSLGLRANKDRGPLIDQIVSRAFEQGDTEALNATISELVVRPKEWVSIKRGHIPHFPKGEDPVDLLTGPGVGAWYGPITLYPPDDVVTARWYIRPVEIPHYEKMTDGTIEHVAIRWLCYARLERDVMSLHWRGFTYANEVNQIDHTTQFNYWTHVPGLFRELENLCGAELTYPKLHRMVLHVLWDEYRDNPEYKWTDRRIRAESAGVTLNAHAGAILDIGGGGILQLARTIRAAVEIELGKRHHLAMPQPEHYDEIILRTLIREYGTLSYEFSLESANELLLHVHSYFGFKPQSDLPDRFPHMRIIDILKRRPLKQLEFFVDQLRNTSTVDGDDDETPKTGLLPLFR